MDPFTPLATIIFAALIHASFQLSVSVLTLLSGHAIGSKASHSRLLRLTGSFILGAFVMTTLLLMGIVLVLVTLLGSQQSLFLWAISSGLLVGLGIAVWAFYYRREAGTSLWLPRGAARYLTERTKATKQSAEAFSLGLSSILAEILFIAAPLFVSALVISHLHAEWRLPAVALYVAVSLLSLLIVNGLIGSGHSLSRIQKWREDNKLFLQFSAGSGLLILGVYVYVEQILTPYTVILGGSW